MEPEDSPGRNSESTLTAVPEEIHDDKPRNPGNTQERKEAPKRDQVPQKSFFYEPLDKMKVVEALSAQGILLSGNNTSAVVKKVVPTSQILSDLENLSSRGSSEKSSWGDSGIRGYEGTARSSRQSGTESGKSGSPNNSDDDNDFSSEDEDEDEDALSLEDDGADDLASDRSTHSKKGSLASYSSGWKSSGSQRYRKRR